LAQTCHMPDEVLCIEEKSVAVQCKEGENVQAFNRGSEST